MMDYGIVLHGAGMVEAEKALEEIADAGFEFFEYSYGHVQRLDNDPNRELREIADHARSLDLFPVQLHGPSLSSGFDLGSPDPKTRSRSIHKSCKFLNHAAELGVPVMVEHACEYHRDMGRTSELVKKSFSEIASCADEVGVRVAVENEFDPLEPVSIADDRNMVLPARFCCQPSELLQIVAIDPDNLGVCLDFGHANIQKPLLELDGFIRQLNNTLIATHLHDNEGASDQHLVPLEGNIPWKEALRTLRDIEYSSPIILETMGLSCSDIETRRNRLRLRRIIAEHLVGSK